MHCSTAGGALAQFGRAQHNVSFQRRRQPTATPPTCLRGYLAAGHQVLQVANSLTSPGTVANQDRSRVLEQRRCRFCIADVQVSSRTQRGSNPAAQIFSLQKMSSNRSQPQRCAQRRGALRRLHGAGVLRQQHHQRLQRCQGAAEGGAGRVSRSGHEQNSFSTAAVSRPSARRSAMLGARSRCSLPSGPPQPGREPFTLHRMLRMPASVKPSCCRYCHSASLPGTLAPPLLLLL